LVGYVDHINSYSLQIQQLTSTSKLPEHATTDESVGLDLFYESVGLDLFSDAPSITIPPGKIQVVVAWYIM
jgi:hypothetical protein